MLWLGLTATALSRSGHAVRSLKRRWTAGRWADARQDWPIGNNLRKMESRASRRAGSHGFTVQHHHEQSAGPAIARRSPPPRLASRQILRRRTLPGPQAHHAHARPAHGMRKRSLPEYGRVLGARHRHFHDPRRHLHQGVRLLRGTVGQAGRSPGRGRAAAGSGSGSPNGIALCGGDLGQPRRPERRRRAHLRANHRRNPPSRPRLQGRSIDPGFSRRLGCLKRGLGHQARRSKSQYRDGAAPVPAGAQRRSLRKIAGTPPARQAQPIQKSRRKPG